MLPRYSTFLGREDDDWQIDASRPLLEEPGSLTATLTNLEDPRFRGTLTVNVYTNTITSVDLGHMVQTLAIVRSEPNADDLAALENIKARLTPIRDKSQPRRSGGLASGPPAARSAGPPPGDGGVQGFGPVNGQFPAAGLVPLGVQPNAQVVLFAGDECLVPRPVVIAPCLIGDQGFQALLPSVLVGFDATLAFPTRQDRLIPVLLGKRPSVLTPAMKPGRKGAL